MSGEAPVVGGRIVDPDVYRRSAVYADIQAPQKIAEVVMLLHDRLSDGRRTGGFAVCLDHRGADRTDDVAARLERLAPHLRRALDLGLSVSRYAGPGWFWLERLPTPALVIDGGRRVMEANAGAEALFQRPDGLAMDRERRLTARRSEANRALQELLAAALSCVTDAEIGAPLHATLQQASARWIAFATPLPPSAFVVNESVARGARALLQVVDPEARSNGDSGRLQALWGLTPGEARVAALIGTGASVPEAAERLGLSANTVLTHLSRCFDKTGVRSQGGLIRLVTLVPSSGAPPHPIG